MPDDVVSPLPPPAEAVLWKGHTSQWVHFWYYFFCFLLAAGSLAAMPFTFGWSGFGVIVPILMWTSRWWLTKTTVYELTSQRLKITHGILNRRLNELELYRVKDYVMDQPLLLRMMGLGNLTLLSSDTITPTLSIPAIANVAAVREQLRSAVQTERDRKRVRQLDVDETTPLS